VPIPFPPIPGQLTGIRIKKMTNFRGGEKYIGQMPQAETEKEGKFPAPGSPRKQHFSRFNEIV